MIKALAMLTFFVLYGAAWVLLLALVGMIIESEREGKQ